MYITIEDILAGIDELNLQSRLICIHSSLKSFGYLQGGAKALINAFLKKEYTIIVPTFSYDFEVPPPKNIKLPIQNGLPQNYLNNNFKGIGRYFTSRSNEIHDSMGTIPKFLLSFPNRKRGNHPLNSFSAIGKKAEKYIKDQTPKNVYAPLSQLYKDNGYMILMGVDLTVATIIHYAEFLSGRNLFIRWANDSNCNPIPVNVGGCSEGFNNFSSYTKSIEINIQMGNSLWKIFHIRIFIKKILEIIKINPEITRCKNPDCLRCKDSIKGGPIF